MKSTRSLGFRRRIRRANQRRIGHLRSKRQRAQSLLQNSVAGEKKVHFFGQIPNWIREMNTNGALGSVKIRSSTKFPRRGEELQQLQFGAETACEWPIFLLLFWLLILRFQVGLWRFGEANFHLVLRPLVLGASLAWEHWGERKSLMTKISL